MMPAFDRCLEVGYGAFRALRNASLAVLFSGSMVFAEPVVIAAMGDSLTHGYGLPSEEGFVPQMEAWLVGRGLDVQLINAGVSGDTTAGGLSRAAWTLTPEVDAMIVALGANDYLRGIDPNLVRQNIRGILEIAAAQDVEVLLVGLEVGANYGPDYKLAFDAIYPELAEEFEDLYFRSWFAGLEDVESAIGSRTYFQGDGIHPNAAGVKEIVEAMGPAVAELAALVD